jgi:TetR/AcrR family transcriptional regulator, cholesterol catabolism regulator
MAQRIRAYSDNKQLVEDRRVLIAEKATPLFIKKGFKATTVRDIAKVCNMTHSTLYRYVGKKDDIMSLVLQRMYVGTYDLLREIEDKAKKSGPKETLAWAIGSYYRGNDLSRVNSVFVVSNYMFFNPLHRLRVVETHTSIVAAFENVLKLGCQKGDFNIENPWLCAFDIVELGQIWAQRQHIIRNKCTLDEYIEFHTNQIMRQIGAKTLENVKTAV